jgi:recombination protein RecA
MKKIVPLLVALFALGCSQLSNSTAENRSVVLLPRISEGQYRTKTEVSYYTAADINHFVLQLSSPPGGTIIATRDLPKSSLNQKVTLQNLKANKSYRIEAIAYKATGTATDDIISREGSDSYIDFNTTNDDRPTLLPLGIRLIDVPFNGIASSSINIASGSYSYPENELIFIPAHLSGMTISHGTLSPAFQKTVYSYDASTSAQAFTITPSAHAADDVITINGLTVASGSESTALPLNMGNNPISVLVTNSNPDFSSLYNINMTRIDPRITSFYITYMRSGMMYNRTVAIAEAQKNGGVAAFIDAEHALDPEYAKNLGVDVESLLVSQPDNGEQALEITEALVRSSAIDIIVIDSVAALVPRQEIEGDMGDSHVGLQARLMSQALRKLAGVISKTNCVAIFINQLREKVGVTYGSNETTTGGRALKFYASVRLDVRKIEIIKAGSEPIGSRTKVKVVKNKVAPPFKEAEFDIMYGKGISREGEILDIAVKLEIINKSGAWFSYEGNRLGQGRDNSKDYIKNNPELLSKIETQIKDKIKELGASTILKSSSKIPKTAVKPTAAAAVNISADDFDTEEDEEGAAEDGDN